MVEKVVVINLSWEKVPFCFETIKKYDRPSDFGYYQVYGKHPAYGEHSLLYIGKSEKQNFAKRLTERWEFVESTAYPTYFRLGRIVGSNYGEKLELPENVFKIGEEILLRAHAQAFNQQLNRGLFADTGLNFLVINWEDYGKLLPPKFLP